MYLLLRHAVSCATNNACAGFTYGTDRACTIYDFNGDEELMGLRRNPGHQLFLKKVPPHDMVKRFCSIYPPQKMVFWKGWHRFNETAPKQ